MEDTKQKFKVIVFCDISGYSGTALKSVPRAERLTILFEELVNEVLKLYGGRLVKNLGDGALLEFNSCHAALETSTTLNRQWMSKARAIGYAGLLHTGIAAGEVITKLDGDLSGNTVILASRLSDAANPGQVLTSERVKVDLEHSQKFYFHDQGTLNLQGIGDTRVFNVASADNSKMKTIAKDFENAFSEVRAKILRIPTKLGNRHDLIRRGDLETAADKEAWDIYSEVAHKHYMYCVSEHDKHNARTYLVDFEYFLLMDPLDGSVNYSHNLPFGANFAFGQIKSDQFIIRDIEAVLVFDYVREKSFRWISGELPIPTPPKIDGGQGINAGWMDAPNVFEVPDEESYFRGDDNGPKRQERLIRTFRRTFGPDVQRRAIDCTGFRMLEVADQNLIAYGDMRGVTHPWDTIPSIRYMMEEGNIKLLKRDGSEYQGDEWIVRESEGRFVRNDNLGDTVIVLCEQYEKSFRTNAEKEGLFKL